MYAYTYIYINMNTCIQIYVYIFSNIYIYIYVYGVAPGVAEEGGNEVRVLAQRLLVQLHAFPCHAARIVQGCSKPQTPNPSSKPRTSHPNKARFRPVPCQPVSCQSKVWGQGTRVEGLRFGIWGSGVRFWGSW